MKDLKKIDLTYLDTASSRMQMTANIKAPLEFVFKIFEDADAWVHCFQAITRVNWTSEPPYKKGTTRTIDLKLPSQPLLTIDEEFVEWEQNKRFAFYFQRSSRRVFNAMIEDYKFTEGANGSTDIVWDLAYEGVGIYKFIFKLIAGQAKKDNQKALNNFRDYIEEQHKKSLA